MPTFPHFQGLQTEPSFYALGVALFIIGLYAFLTTWVFVRFSDWLFSAMSDMPQSSRGLAYIVAPLITIGTLFYLCSGHDGLWFLLVPIVAILLFFGAGVAGLMVPPVFCLIVLVFLIVWYPVGALTGMGWVGVFPYMYFCFKIGDFGRA